MTKFKAQISGKIKENNEEIYFSSFYGLYFYKSHVTENVNTVDCQLKYIEEEELENKKLSSGEEFILFELSKENCDLKEVEFDVDKTNIILPGKLIEERIVSFNSFLKQMKKTDENFQSPDMLNNNKFDTHDLVILDNEKA